MFTASPDELTTWDRYDRIRLPVHLIRGASSDILPKEIADRMAGTGPRPEVTVFDDCGHAPTMSRPADLDIMRGILERLDG